MFDGPFVKWTEPAQGGTITSMLQPGGQRKRLASTLGAAYADGLLSQETFAHRIDQLFSDRVVDPVRLVGDLRLRGTRRRPRLLDSAWAAARRLLDRTDEGARDATLLALDWTGAQGELVIGRSSSCDVVLPDPNVSRRHVRLVYRDGKWVCHDLDTTNGTWLNGARLGRSELRPGDRLVLATEHLRID